MSEKERLNEAAALFLERERKMAEVVDLERRIKVALGIGGQDKRKKPLMSGKDWEKALRVGA